MNRNQRRIRGPRRIDSPSKLSTFKNKCANEIKEVFLGKTKNQKAAINRCCYISPDQRDFTQNTDNGNFVAISIPVDKKNLINNYTEQSELLLTDTYTQPRQNGHLGKHIYSQLFEEGSMRLIHNNYTEQDDLLRHDICTSPPEQRGIYLINEYNEPNNLDDQYKTLQAEQYGLKPILPETITQLKELKKLFCDTEKPDDGSQCDQRNDFTPPRCVETCDGSWQNVDNVEDIDKMFSACEHKTSIESPMTYDDVSRDIYISDIPRVKVIAEKFSKYKKNNLELRRLDEKVVCVEYDIFDQESNGEVLKPVQRMRAFFSIKPIFEDDNRKGELAKVPSKIKRNFNILDEDLKKLTDQEIEIIDGNIEQNKSYLEDFRRILKRKRIIEAKKKKSTLDLQSLYDMARRHTSPLSCDFSNANLLSKAELQEVKDLILQRCASSVHGISRRRVKSRDADGSIEFNVLSDSIVAELLREDTKFNA